MTPLENGGLGFGKKSTLDAVVLQKLIFWQNRAAQSTKTVVLENRWFFHVSRTTPNDAHSNRRARTPRRGYFLQFNIME